jgi:GTP-binding protein
MQPLFDLILSHVKPPTVEEGPFRMLGTILEANPYLGRIITGRITSAPSSRTRRQGARSATAS